MAVFGRCENGFLVDHKKSISDTVSSLSLSCKETFFALYEPYFRSSTENSCDKIKGKAKRKVTTVQNKFISLMKIAIVSPEIIPHLKAFLVIIKSQFNIETQNIYPILFKKTGVDDRCVTFADCRLLAVSFHCRLLVVSLHYSLLAVSCSLAVWGNTILLSKWLKSNHSLQSVVCSLQMSGTSP